MEEEGEMQRGHQLKLLSEVLVLSLREKRPSLSHLLVAKVETIIVQTKLSNRHDLLFGLPFLPNGDSSFIISSGFPSKNSEQRVG